MGVPPSRSASPGDVLLAHVVAGIPGGESPLIHVVKLPPRTADVLDWPDWADPDVVAALRRGWPLRGHTRWRPPRWRTPASTC